MRLISWRWNGWGRGGRGRWKFESFDVMEILHEQLLLVRVDFILRPRRSACARGRRRCVATAHRYVHRATDQGDPCRSRRGGGGSVPDRTRGYDRIGRGEEAAGALSDGGAPDSAHC